MPLHTAADTTPTLAVQSDDDDDDNKNGNNDDGCSDTIDNTDTDDSDTDSTDDGKPDDSALTRVSSPISSNRFDTFAPVRADTSIHSTSCSSAKASPSSTVTWRFASRSHLLPTTATMQSLTAHSRSCFSQYVTSAKDFCARHAPQHD
jgi:hypothetical protein